MWSELVTVSQLLPLHVRIQDSQFTNRKGQLEVSDYCFVSNFKRAHSCSVIVICILTYVTGIFACFCVAECSPGYTQYDEHGTFRYQYTIPFSTISYMSHEKNDGS